MAKTLDPIQAAHLVLNTIDAWLKAAGAGSFNAAKTIADNPPKGYAMSPQRYLKFCADISKSLSDATGRKLNLNKAFRDAHFGDTMGDFAAAVTVELLKAPITVSGAKLLSAAKKIAP
jgi:hypothetical protein